MLRHLVEPEVLQDEEQYYCEACKSKQDAVKRYGIARLPRILVIQINRAKWQKHGYDPTILRFYDSAILHR